MTLPRIRVALDLPRRPLRTHSPARRHATAGAQRPPSLPQAESLPKLSTKNPCVRHPGRGKLAPCPLRASTPHTPPRVPAHSHLRNPRRDIRPLHLLPTVRSRETWARRGVGGSGDTTNMAAAAATLINAEAVAAANKAAGILRCSCQEVSNGKSARTAAPRLSRAR